MIGKSIRLERIINRNSRRAVMVPMDHGITLGPISGLQDMKVTVNSVVEGGANAIILHKGIVGAGHRGYGEDVGLILHLSASTALSPDPNEKRLVSSVEEALVMGADAVSVHVNLGAEGEPRMLSDLGRVSKECARWGMPLLAMMYARGEKIRNPFAVENVKHAARVAAELGADVVKVVYTGSPESFAEVVDGCHVPVVIAGGEKVETEEELLEMVAGSLEAGGIGVSIGRNVFQHPDPAKMVRAISAITHENASVDDAMAVLKG
jgi:predicted phospho-2-dehydro-3-deoxyheptonate aldolase